MVKKFFRFVFRMVRFGLVLGLVGLVACAAGWFILERWVIPQRIAVLTPENIQQQLSGESPVLYADGVSPIGALKSGEKRRRPVTYAQIPADCVNAIIAAEDKRFKTHGGVDWQGFFGNAILRNIKSRSMAYGGSTIPVQVAKLIVPRASRSKIGPLAKLLEMVDGVALKRRYSNEQLMEFYWNSVYINGSVVGIERGAQYFFQKPLNELSLHECAYMGAMAKGATKFDPFLANGERARQRAVERVTYVLGRMAEDGYITNTQRNELVGKPIPFAEEPGQTRYEANVLVDATLAALNTPEMTAALAEYGISDVSASGFQFVLNVDKAPQEAALEALRKQTTKMGGEKRDGAVVAIGPDGIKVMVGGKSQAGLNRALTALRPMGSTAKMWVVGAYLTLGGSITDLFENYEGLCFPYLDHVGSRAYCPNADHEPVSPMSLEDGMARSENVLFVNVLYRLTQWLSEQDTIDLAKRVGMWPAKGEDTKVFFRDTLHLNTMSEESLRAGLDMVQHPELFAELSLLDRFDPKRVVWDRDFRVMLGIKYLVSMARALGVDSKLEPVLSLALGSQGITQLEGARLIRALLTGYALPPALREPGLSLLKEIRDSTGKTIWTSAEMRKEVRVLPPYVTQAVASLGVKVFEDKRGTAHAARNAVLVNGFRLPLVGKTGTTNGAKTLNFVGCLPSVTVEGAAFSAALDQNSTCVAVYVGHDDNANQGRQSAASAALPVWARTANALATSILRETSVKVTEGGEPTGTIPLVGATAPTYLFGSRPAYRPIVETTETASEEPATAPVEVAAPVVETPAPSTEQTPTPVPAPQAEQPAQAPAAEAPAAPAAPAASPVPAPSQEEINDLFGAVPLAPKQ